MNREIKFRAWNREKRRMFRIARFDFSDNTIYSHLFACDGFLGEDCEIMQYTGSKDMNGVEIYEGDIYKYKYYFNSESYEYRYSVVEWRSSEIAYEGVFHGYELDESYIEVVGNIYENPEFLQEDN